jgi:hypothetical protein
MHIQTSPQFTVFAKRKNSKDQIARLYLMISFGKKAMKRASASIVILPIGIVTSF